MLAMSYGSIADFTRVICWQHDKRNVEKHLNLAFRNDIRNDIRVLQACQSKELFDKAAKLFQEKLAEESGFLQYFVKTWLKSKQRGWYQGFAIAVPDHNNNNESDNRYIKEDQGRKRFGFMQFLVHAEENLVHDLSFRRRSESYAYVK